MTIKDPKQLEKVRQRALRLLTRRDHTYSELTTKLLRKDCNPDDIKTILADLSRAGLINETRFAENYTQYRRKKGYGPKRISMELAAKGVAETVIAEQVQITDNAWLTEIRTIWRKRFKGQLPTDPPSYARQTRFLYNRGFSQDQIKSILSNADSVDE